MRPTLILALSGALATASPVTGQVLDRTLVPGGQVRLQAHPHFTSWNARYGRLPDGSTEEEALGADLTAADASELFPGVPSLAAVVRDLVGSGDYSPLLGRVDGRVTQDVTQIDFGAHIGVFDWLTVGAVLPWLRTSTSVDLAFAPDTIVGNLGLNPVLTSGGSVESFLAATVDARSAAEANASTECAAGPSASCTAAQSLASRTADFSQSVQTAYGASSFFPLASAPVAADLLQIVAALDADLTAAGVTGLSAPMPFAAERLAEEGLALVPSLLGGGIDAASLQTRTGLWAAGDVEVTARVRLLDNQPADRPPPAFGYHLTASGLVRLPTGTREDADIFLDLGTGDAQTDLEGGLHAMLFWGGRAAIALEGRYGTQRSTTITTRVVAPEVVIAPLSTRRSLTYSPGSYVHVQAAPALRLTPSLTLHGEYRFFHKRRDSYALIDPDASLDPVVLELESGVKTHRVGGGIRYDTTRPWREGEDARPMELHLRLLHTIAGGGGHVPVSTRVEAGIRLFRRLWGAR